MTEFESRWRDFALTKLDAALDCFKCSDERIRDEAMCCYCSLQMPTPGPAISFRTAP
jgi:hypothetical protein